MFLRWSTDIVNIKGRGTNNIFKPFQINWNHIERSDQKWGQDKKQRRKKLLCFTKVYNNHHIPLPSA